MHLVHFLRSVSPQFDFVFIANADAKSRVFPAAATETDGVGRIPRMPAPPSLFSSSPFPASSAFRVVFTESIYFRALSVWLTWFGLC